MPQQGVRGSGGPIGPNRGGGGGGGQYSGPIQLPSNFGNVGQSGANLTANQEQEKAQLIMQVLALSDRQIEMLPNEQRQSIMLLKEQITRGSN
jgi:cleavage stimulation factor subunit 2